MKSSRLGICAGLALPLAAAPAALAQNAPVADAGADFVRECAAPGGTQVWLDGSGSSDADGHVLSFRWTSPSFPGGAALSGPAPSVLLPLGSHEITLEVSDGIDGSDADVVWVTIEDTTPPVLELGGTPRLLWPPNHSYHRIDVSRFVLAAHDSCDGSLDPSRAHFGQVTSDEPEDDTGDGHSLEDIRIADECHELRVRAERKGNGDGRVYRAEIAIEDASGNAQSAWLDAAHVFKAPPKPAVDSGPAYSVTSSCEPDGPGLCPLLPDTGCDGTLAQGRSMLRLYDHPRSSDLDALFFLMSSVDTHAARFGDPTAHTEYQLCVYGRQTGAGRPSGLIVNPRASAGSAWRAVPGGFVYRSRRDDDDGLTSILLRAGDGGRGSVLVWGLGDDLEMADLPLGEATGAEVQLHNSLGHCWGAALPGVLRNTETLFQATGH